jgi:pyruvate,water dikinase
MTTGRTQKIRVPDGYATTAHAYWTFLEANQLTEPIRDRLAALQRRKQSVAQTGHAIRTLFLHADIPEEIATGIRIAYQDLSRRSGMKNVDVAVRSSATAEDLPGASFAGQQESFLNICGEDTLLAACKKCYASLFTDRAISYRIAKGFDHLKVALSIGIQKMVRADKASAGVMFSLDPETGFPRVVVINAAWD